MIYNKYQDRIQRTKEEILRLNKAINQNSFARLFVIISGGALLFYLVQKENLLLLFLAVLTIVFLFAFLVRRQSKLEKVHADAEAFLRVNENEITLRNTRRTIYNDGAEFEDGGHQYTADLDVFGQFSLFSLVNRCATSLGINKLAGWLQCATTKVEIEERQKAIAEITEDLDWSQKFQSRLLFNIGQKIEVKSFLLRYFEGSSLTFGGRFMRLYVPIAPFILLVGVLFSLFVMPIWTVLLLLGLIHLFWTLGLAGKVGLFSSRIDKVGQILAAYAEGLALVEERTFVATENQRLQQQLSVDGKPLSGAFRELSKLINNLDARNNMLMGAILNIILLWDFKYVMKIVEWKSKYEADILEAFDIIAEFEALNSLAILKRNHPSWTTPELLSNTTNDKIVAVEIAHPLIPAVQSVANDYSNEQHRIALITGSNMAGKSTFLRTIGINAVLAYAGAVTCATVFKLPIYNLISYMRIRDSLNESTSTFKAELDRMKFILDTVKQDKDSFFLIDEMLRGTNSVDKYLGSRAIIRKLIAMEGKGMVATHDLQLASLEEENIGRVQNYHFDIRVEEGEMLFDYKLKNGRCTIFNASLLLKGIGIDVESI
ncbi:MutS-related protein [Sphingobacterium gobiense]|uniref:DNA mismatch repair protein MutS n=1 Tax=Sphingobacterium gobiense TaxID=1382456 RepID=A0A2S9JIC1_9SPHI|nr:DNA mismatch repair protein MutS [Sphingobacterium gobiense]PRD52773.1 DNA mismatch repair protein MutS [Sphingobacterium gobiense]